MPRLFTGLEVPPDVTAELQLLRGGLPGARWIEPEDFHVTLRFIGDIDVGVANEVAQELESVGHGPIEVRLERLSAFGNDRPHALVALAAASDGLVALAAEHERAMRRIGLKPEARRFTPHVTLARLRGVSAAAVAAYIETRGGLRPLRFTANRFALYSSRASTGGGPYRVEVGFPL